MASRGQQEYWGEFKEQESYKVPQKLSFPAAMKASSIDVNASSGPAFPALELDELRAKVQRVVMYGSVGEAWHSGNDRAYRNVSIDDILYMLDRPWVLSAEPDWDDKHRNWEYLLAGTDIEGDPLSSKITVNDELLRILVITKF